MPVVVISGMRQAGKSTFLLNQPELKNRKYFNFDDFAVLEAARRNPEELLAANKYITIDEAHKYPQIFQAIKREVDSNRLPGRFLLSGSANFLLLKNISETLAGRAVYLTLHPFIRREIQGTTKQLPALVHFIDKGYFPERQEKPVSWKEIVLGGMPSVCLGQVKKAQVWFRGYEQTYLERDIRELSQVADLVSFRNFLQLVALRNTTILNQSELARDAKMNAMTASRYLSLLEASFVVRRLPPYLKNPSSRIIKSPKIYLSDTGLASYLAGLTQDNVTQILGGAWLENYIAHNLEVICSTYCPDAAIAYWNVQGRHEVDFIIDIGRETIAIEVKNSSRWQERDLAGLGFYLNSAADCRAAILAYNGKEVVKLDKKIWAVPIGLLLS